jgi:pimeloyl-ACP methyl ester carboxylesterase
MASLDVGGARLFYEQHGAAGPPMVLVHGSWVDHTHQSHPDDFVAQVRALAT